MAWVGAQYIGLGSAGAHVDEKSLACVIKSSAGDRACSAVAAAVLASVDDDTQNDSQGTYSAVAASTPQTAVSSELERDEAFGGGSQPDADGSPVGNFIEVDEGAAFGDGEPQYIGEYIDPDAEDGGLVPGDDNPVSIGEPIDPDGEISLDIDVAEQTIGAFIDPDAG
jgi:hypothetical protein